jgi:amidophosphoribosyltransferase
MCGIVGVVLHQPANQVLFDALTTLQHRGQDAAGIMTCENNRLFLRKSNGLVRDVFHTRHMFRLRGQMGIGHVRYPTSGCDSSAEAQPFYVNSPYGISLAHNGNLTNSQELARELFLSDRRHLNTNSDSEVLLNVFAHELQLTLQIQLTPAAIFEAVKRLHQRTRGAYAVVAMITGYGVIAFRDPHGIRPLIYGSRESSQGTEYMFASESVALSSLGFQILADVGPGEAVIVTQQGEIFKQSCAPHAQLNPCLFEYVYLARPDSVIDHISVYKMRLRLGDKLAEKILKNYPNHDIDVVIPIPDTSRTAAHSLAQQLGVKYREGMVKNRYIGRTFIMPGQKERQKSVRQKLNTIDLEFAEKNVLLVDDSIVRGTTAREIVQMARQAGAKKVYFASAAPQVRYPNVYGIDIPVPKELIAHERSETEIAQFIGADWLIFQDLDALIEAAQEGNPAITRFEDSVFSGQYVTGDISSIYLQQVAQMRTDAAKAKNRNITAEFPEYSQLIDLYDDE